MSKTHHLKVYPEYFCAIIDGTKPFEVRKDDRGFEVGDALILREWNDESYTGRAVRSAVTYILKGGGVRNRTRLRHHGDQAGDKPKKRTDRCPGGFCRCNQRGRFVRQGVQSGRLERNKRASPIFYNNRERTRRKGGADTGWRRPLLARPAIQGHRGER